MVQSLNTKVDLVIDGTSFTWISDYGKIMIGDKGFELKTKRNGTYIFASKDPKEVLRTVRKYVDPNHMVQSLSFFDVVKRGVKSMFKGKSK